MQGPQSGTQNKHKNIPKYGMILRFPILMAEIAAG